MENGLVVAKLMDVLRNHAVQGLPPKVASMLVLDPLLQIMPDSGSILEIRKNWNFIEKELIKFGIEFEAETKRNIVIGNEKVIIDFLSFLVDFYRGGNCTNIGKMLLVTTV